MGIAAEGKRCERMDSNGQAWLDEAHLPLPEVLHTKQCSKTSPGVRALSQDLSDWDRASCLGAGDGLLVCYHHCLPWTNCREGPWGWMLLEMERLSSLALGSSGDVHTARLCWLWRRTGESCVLILGGPKSLHCTKLQCALSCDAQQH